MTAPPHEYDQEAWLKHLEFVQNVITRLASNSFLIKGWALTVSGALYGFAASHLSWPIAAVGLVPTALFWYLDSFFLMSERIYRGLYNDVAKNSDSVAPFSLDPSPYRGTASQRSVIMSRTLAPFYGMLAAAGLVLIIAILAHQIAT